MKTSFLAMIFLAGFCRPDASAQCDINYSTTSFNLALDFNGEAFLTTASFYPTYVTSSNSNCNPPTGTLGIWENSGATTPYGTTLPFPFTCNHVGFSYNVWVTLDDPAPGGQSSAVMFTVTIVDNEDPVVITPNVSNPYNVDLNTCARVLTFQASAADNCSNLTYSHSLSGATTGGPFVGFIANHAFNVGTTTITWSVSDGTNTETATSTVTVVDNQPPVFVGALPGNVTLPANGSCQATHSWTHPTVSDNCGINSSSITPSGTPPITFNSPFNSATLGLGATTFTYVYSDGVNAITHSFTVTVTDQTAPVFAVNPTQTNVSTTTCFANVSLIRPATDNCNTPTVTFTINTVSGGPDPFPVEPVSGNNASGSYPVGVYYITFTAKDAANNMTMRTDTLTVEDNIDPVITSCSPGTVYLDANGDVVVDGSDFSPVASDNCGVDAFEIKRQPFASNPWQDTLEYHCADHGNTYNVRIRALDAAGNESAFCATTVTILDTLPPTAQCKNIVVNLDLATWGPNIDSVDVFPIEINNGSTDNCTAAGSLNLRLRKGTSGAFEPVGMPLYFDCSEVGVNTVTLRVGDTNGNPNFCTATVTVNDVTPPNANAVNVTRNLSNSLPGNGSATVNASDADLMLVATSTDNCAITLHQVSRSINGPWAASVTYNCADLSTPNPDKIYVRVTDIDGNTNVDSALVTVQDVDLPTLNCPASDTIYLDATGNRTLTALDLAYPIPSGSPGQWASDNCSITSAQIRIPPFAGIFATAWQNAITFDCGDVGGNTVRFRATDQSGNLASFCAVNLVVLDTVDPSAACLDLNVSLNTGGTVLVAGSQVGIASQDNCTGFLFLNRQISLDANGDGNPDLPYAPNVTFDCDDIGDNDVLVQVTDGSGNSSTCSATVTVEDLLDPTIVCPPDTSVVWVTGLSLDPDDIGNEVVIFPAAPGSDDGIAADNCEVTVTWDDVDTTYAVDCSVSGYVFFIEREWTAEDGQGNLASCTQYVTLIDTLAPTFTAPADATLDCPLSYSVANHLCDTWSNTVDVSISDINTSTVTSTIVVPAGGKIQDVNVLDLQISHTFISDLQISLTSPDGTTIVLFDNECGSQNNMDINFDDDGAAAGTFPCPPIDQSFYEPFQALSAFINEDAAGTWTLTIFDGFNQDGGALTNWGLEICYVTPGTDDESGEVTDAADDCDASVEATFKDYEAFKDFQFNLKNTKPLATGYDFGDVAWAYSETEGGAPSGTDAFVDFSNVPASISITGANDELCVGPFTDAHADLTITIPADGWVSFDWSYQSQNSAAGFDPFGYLIDPFGAPPVIYTQLTDGDYGTFTGAISQSGTVLVPVSAGEVFGFSQRSYDSSCGAATTTISNFVFIDEDICPVPEFGCFRNFCVARVWDLEDDCGNQAASQLQVITTQDVTGPDFNGYPNAVTVLAVGGVCAPAVDLDLSGDVTDGCSDDLVITNDALVNYGKGDGLADATDLYAPGTYVITFTATDDCGNSTSHVVTLDVIDDQDPFAVCFDEINVQLDNTGNASITYVNIDNGSSDNCGIVSYSLSQSAFTVGDVGQVPVVLTVADADGNTNTCVTLVNVLGGLTFDAGDGSGVTGSTILVPVTVELFNNITSFQLDLNITNPAVANFTATSIVNVHASLSSGGVFTPNQAAASATWFSNPPFTGLTLPAGTKIFDVQVTLLGASGSSTPLVITNDDGTHNVAGNPNVPVSTLGIGGTISVVSGSATHTISGTLRREANCTTPAGDPVGLALVTLSGSSTTSTNPQNTGAPGTYSFTVPAGSNPTIAPTKNTSWTNGILIDDVVAVNNHILGSPQPQLGSAYKKIAADINRNGIIQIGDVFGIFQLSQGSVPSGLGNSWEFVDAATLVVPGNPNLTPTFQNVKSFTGVNANQTQNFVGVKMGDVTCSANAQTFTGEPVAGGSAHLPFFVENQSVTAGDELTVTFRAKDFADFIGYQTTLSFDPQVLQFQAFEPLNLENLSVANHNPNRVSEGLLATAWFANSGVTVPDGEQLFALKFKALQNVSSLQDVLSATSDFIERMCVKGGTGETGDVSLVFGGGALAADEAEADGFSLLQNRPNPFSQQTVIGFRLPEATAATLTLSDANGRMLKVVEGNFPAGYNQVEVSRTELPTAGVIFYRLETAKHSAVRKMVIVD